LINVQTQKNRIFIVVGWSQRGWYLTSHLLHFKSKIIISHKKNN